MTTPLTKALILTADDNEVRLNGHHIGYGPMRGYKQEQNLEAAEHALATLLAERLGWPVEEETW